MRRERGDLPVRDHKMDAINRRMITVARESRGLTQAALCQLIGKTQGWLSKVENGMGRVTDEEAAGIARALGYPKELLYQQDLIYGIGVSEMYYRRQQGVSARMLGLIQARANLRAMQIARMLKGVDMGEIDFPRMDPAEYRGGAAEVAEYLRAHWMLPAGPVQSVTAAIETAGGIVVPFDFGGAKVDALSFWPPGLPPLFFVRLDVPVDRLRFSLCHELGHVIMHSGTLSPDVEREAHLFAASFLMPEQDIRRQLRQEISFARLAMLKPIWKVSMAALLHRAIELGLVPQWRARELWAQLSPYKVVEPVTITEHEETPELLNEIVRVYRERMGYSIEDFAKMVMLEEDEARAIYFPAEVPRLRMIKS